KTGGNLSVKFLPYDTVTHSRSPIVTDATVAVLIKGTPVQPAPLDKFRSSKYSIYGACGTAHRARRSVPVSALPPRNATPPTTRLLRSLVQSNVFRRAKKKSIRSGE